MMQKIELEQSFSEIFNDLDNKSKDYTLLVGRRPIDEQVEIIAYYKEVEYGGRVTYLVEIPTQYAKDINTEHPFKSLKECSEHVSAVLIIRPQRSNINLVRKEKSVFKSEVEDKIEDFIPTMTTRTPQTKLQFA